MHSEHFLLVIKPVDAVRYGGVNPIIVAALFQFIHWTAARRQYQSGVSDPGSSYPRDSPGRSVSIRRLVPLEAGLCILWQKNDGAKRLPQIFNFQ
jgi:hypothetical protein